MLTLYDDPSTLLNLQNFPMYTISINILDIWREIY